MREARTILYGDREVPVIERKWKSRLAPYATHRLQPGQHWWKDVAARFENVCVSTPDWTRRLTQQYVVLETATSPTDSQATDAPIVYSEDRDAGVEYIPAEAAIARQLKSEGAGTVVWSDVWGSKRVFVGADLVCLSDIGPIAEFLDKIRLASSRQLLGGLPDVIACFTDGRVALREAKHVSAKYKDRLGPKQHEFARATRDLLGDKLDLAVVEWGLK